MPNKSLKQENLQLAVFTAFNILANYKFPLNEALCADGVRVMDMTSEYLEGCSPYIDRLIYDIGKRQLILVCVDSPEICKPVIEIIFTGIESYKEETLDDEYDDQCIDSVIGINWLHEKTICIHTEKKEIIIKFDGNFVKNSIA